MSKLWFVNIPSYDCVIFGRSLTTFPHIIMIITETIACMIVFFILKKKHISFQIFKKDYLNQKEKDIVSL